MGWEPVQDGTLSILPAVETGSLLGDVLKLIIVPSILGGVLALILLRVYSLFVVHKRENYPPTTSGLQLMGVIGPLLFSGHSVFELHKVKGSLHRIYGDIFCQYMDPGAVLANSFKDVPHIEVASPEVVKELLMDKKNIAQQRLPEAMAKKLTRELANGILFLPDGEEWSRHRRLLSPLFSENYLRKYCDAISSKAHILCQKWKEELTRKRETGEDMEEGEDSPLIDVSVNLIKITLDVIGYVGFGTEFNAIRDDASGYEEAGRILAQAPVKGAILPFGLIHLDILGNRKIKKSLQLYMRAVDSMVQKYDEMRKKGEQPEVNFLSALLSAQEHCKGDDVLTGDALKASMITMLLAGHETTANTLSWALYLLSTHPEAQKKVQEEVDKVMPQTESIIDYAAISGLLYTKAVFYEALRMYPTVPFFPRLVRRDCTFGGYHFPEGSPVWVNTSVMTKDQRNWVRPDSFEPERFIHVDADGVTTIKSLETAGAPFSFLPFGAGPRSCIGKRFAVLEGVGLLAVILRNFQLRMGPEEPKSAAAITLYARNGVKLHLDVRD